MSKLDQLEALCDALTLSLRDEPPGAVAQNLMAPVPRRGADGSVLRQGAVLVLLYASSEGVCLPLTRRSADLVHHGGQISLPGGGWEPSDASLADTALREAREELGIDPGRVHVLGALSPLHIPVSGNHVFPFVGCHSGIPRFRFDPAEVAEVIETPLKLLFRPDIRHDEVRIRDGAPIRTPYYSVGGHKVWGATAMILSEFIALVRKAL